MLDVDELLNIARFTAFYLEEKRDMLAGQSLSDFELLAYETDWTRQVETARLIEAITSFGVFTGRTCSGKTFFVNRLVNLYPERYVQLPEVMTREPRYEDGEIDGRDLIYMPEDEFLRRLERKEFFLAFKFGKGESSKLVGLLVAQMRDAIADRRMKLLIADPYELSFLLPLFPLTRCVFLRTTKGDWRRFRKKRRRQGKKWRYQNELGVSDDRFCDLPVDPLTESVWNSPDRTEENTRRIIEFLNNELFKI